STRTLRLITRLTLAAPRSTALLSFSLMIPPPPSSTLFPYTTLFRSGRRRRGAGPRRRRPAVRAAHPATPLAPGRAGPAARRPVRSEEHTSELQSRENLVCRLLLEKKKKNDVRRRYVQAPEFMFAVQL